MGYYVNTMLGADAPLGVQHKGETLVELGQAARINKPSSFNEIPSDKALLIEVNNGFFSALAYVYNEREFKEFTSPNDFRPKDYFLADKTLVEITTNYSR